MSVRAARRRVLFACISTAFALPPVASAGPPWSPPVKLDTRMPLEFGQPRQDPNDGWIFVPTLFQMPAANSLEMVVLDTSTFPPTYASHTLATGSNFALGAAAQVGERIGFSFIDPFFDGRFGTCLPPCTNPTNQAVLVGTFIDSASAGSADDFFVALLDNAPSHSIVTRYSTDGGAIWQTLHTTLPPQPGGVYSNFQGGKRIGLLVDSLATDPLTTRNCLLYETRPAPGNTTALRIHCRNGITSSGAGAFDIVLDTDVPNAGGTFDKFIETNCVMLTGEAAGSIVCGYSHRQTQQMRVVRVNPNGTIAYGPAPVGAAPPGTDIFGLTVTQAAGSSEAHLLRIDSDGDGILDVTIAPPAGHYHGAGPPGGYIPVTSTHELSIFKDPGYLFFAALFGGYATHRREGEGEGDWNDEPLGSDSGLFFSHQRVPLFADGFDTGNTLRW